MSCPTHPQSIVWHHPDGDRCGICARFFDGREPAPAEQPIVRTFAHYSNLVDRTDAAPHWPGGRFPLEYHAGCLNEEAGEFFGKAKKVIYHGHTRDDAMLAKMREELGDCLWYLDRCAERIGTTLEIVAAENIEKLNVRYPDGFSKERSQRRTTT